MPIYFATASSQIFAAWPAMIAAVIGVVIGTLAGERVLRRIPEKLFRKTVSAILLAIGLVVALMPLVVTDASWISTGVVALGGIAMGVPMALSER